MARGRDYTKNELRHKHAQEKLKAEHRKRQLDKQGVSVKRARTQESASSEFLITTTQAGKIVSWYREIDFTKTTWFKTRDILANKISDTEPKINETKSYDSLEDAFAALYNIGEKLADIVCEIACKPHRNDDEELHWSKKIIETGALNDKATAASLLIRSCPVLASRQLDQILKHNHAINRTEHSMGLASFLDLWRDKAIIPTEEELQVMSTPNEISEAKQEFTFNKLARKHFIKRKKEKYYIMRDDELIADTVASRLLIALIFEHQIIQLGLSVLKILQKRVIDPVEYTRHESYRAAIDMMKKPTLRETATRLALRYLGDNSGSLTNRLNLELGKVLLFRPDLKLYVCSRVCQSIWMQKIDLLELSRRDALTTSNGMIKASDSKAIRLARKAHSAKNEIISNIGKSNEQLLRKEKNMNSAHNIVCRALKFLADVSYQASEEELIAEQFSRYLLLLKKIMTPTQAPKLERIQQKQIKFIRNNRNKDLSAEELSEAARKIQGDLTQYVVGLGHSIVGSVALRYLLLGLKRLLPYCTHDLLASLPKMDCYLAAAEAETVEPLKQKRAKAAAEVVTDKSETASQKTKTPLSKLGSEIMKVAHQIPCYATRIHAWSLCHSIYKLMKEEHFVYTNLYAQLKDFRYMQTRAKNSWLRLIIAVITDTERCPASIRSAFLRRLISVLLLLDVEAAPLPLLLILKDSLMTDQTALGEWIGECLGVRVESGLLEDKCYDYSVFSPEKANAMQGRFWELSLAKCSLIPSISAAYNDLTMALKYEGDSKPPQMCSTSLGWEGLAADQDIGDDSSDDMVTEIKSISSRLYKFSQRSQSLQVLYRMLRGQTLRAAVKDKSKKNANKSKDDGCVDDSETSDLEIMKSVWDYDIYDENLWRATQANNFLFPFRRFVEPAFKHISRRRREFKDFEAEVDEFADRYQEIQ